MSILGTAREAYENSQYNKLVEKYGKDGAKAIIEPPLREIGITIEKFEIYLEVKKAIQNDGLNVKKARSDAERLANSAINEVLLC